MPLRSRTAISRAVITLSASLAALAAGACGSSVTWTPPPVSALPVHPGPAQPEASDSPAADPGSSAQIASAPKGPSPIPGDIPADLDPMLVASATCAQKECAVPGLYPPIQVIDGKAPAAVWSHDIREKGSAVTFPKHSGVDIYGVTLKGSVKIQGTEAKSAGLDAGRWVAFHAPGAGISVTANEAGARVLFAVVGGGSPIAEVVVELRGKDPKRLAWKNRPAPIAITDLSAAKDLAWANGSMHARIGFEGEKHRASLGLLLGSKDAPVAQHTHDTSWEILAVLTAGGMLQRADKAGSTELTPVGVTDGVVVAIPKGALHAWEPGGFKPLVGVQIYVPPGPEQRFKQLAAQGSSPSP